MVIRPQEAHLPKDSVANVSQVVTLDRDMLIERIGRLGQRTMSRLEHGLRLVLALS